MALTFKKVKRTIRFGEEQGKEKYYAIAKITGLTSLEGVCNLISARSSMSSADVKAVLDSLNWALQHELNNGRAIQLGELGNFRLSLSSDGADSKSEVTAHKIRKARVIFSPGNVLRETCNNVSFAPYDEKEAEEAECDKEHYE